MTDTPDTSEVKILGKWKLILGLLGAVVFPTLTAAGAFYGLKANLVDRISAVELNVERNFADKGTIRDIQNDIKTMRDDVSDMKSLLRQRHSTGR